MTTGRFWASAAERAVKTASQVAVALIGTGAVGVTALDWAQIGSVSATAAVVSVLTSLASDRIGTPGPSLVGEQPTAPATSAPTAAPVSAAAATWQPAAPVAAASTIPAAAPATVPPTGPNARTTYAATVPPPPL